MHRRKILIIGLDGGTWRILTPMIERGLMPTLKKLTENGTYGILESTIPPVTAPAWSTFHTGVNPGKHGIYDFQEFNRKTRESKLINADYLRVKTFWDLLNEKGKKTISINVPVTYPPKDVENRIATGCFLSPKVDETIVRPKELYKDLLEYNYKIVAGPLQERYSMSLDDFIDKQIQTEKSRFGLAEKWLVEKDWDVFMVHNQTIDGIQHAFYPFIDPMSPNFDKKKFDIISRFYIETDQLINKMLVELSEDTIVFIISDHGFMEIRRRLYINEWLKTTGYLTYKKNNVIALLNLISKIDIFRIRKRLLGRIFNPFGARELATSINTKCINWEKTVAFMGNGNSYGNIYINENDSSKRETLIQELINKLKELSDPLTGKRIIECIYKTSDIYKGPYVTQFPDLFIQPCEGYVCVMTIVSSNSWIATTDLKYDYIGCHERDGIFVAWGKNIKKNRGVKFSIQDIAPTALALITQQVPAYMDGRVLNEIFIKNIQYDLIEIHADKEGKGTIQAENGEVKERLADLGYL
jgi:predicted AlkP superfamily phosphohydrolase/phosphomutase